MKNSKNVELNSPKERSSRIRHRSPGKVSTTGSSYFDSLQDRTDFRNKMRYELKATAKESFLEELGQLRRSNQLLTQVDNEKQYQLELEVQQLRKMVDDLKDQNGPQRNNNANAIEAHWTAMQQYPAPGGFDRFASDNSSLNSLVARNNSNYMPALTASPNGKRRQNSSGNSNVNKNGLFVLSCAPLHNFEDVVHSELSNTGDKVHNATSTISQIQQYNELQSLFALPSYESEFQNIYAMQRELQTASRQQQPSSTVFDEREAKEGRLQTAIDKHRSRLEVSREIYSNKHSPRAPSSPPVRSKSVSLRSPRPFTNGGSSFGQSPSPGKSHTAPSPHNGRRLFVANATGFTDVSASLEGTSLQLDANSSLKEIVRSSMNDYAALVDSGEPVTDSAALRVQDLSVDEFRSITDKMKDDIQRLIEDTVREELLADSKARRYTKRAEAATLLTHEMPLNQKIEAKIGDKIQSLKNELASLRMTKLHLKPVDSRQGTEGGSPSPDSRFMSRRPNRGGATVDREDDDSLGFGEDGERPLGDSNWFSKNELGMRSNPESPLLRTSNGAVRIGEKGLEENDEQLNGAAAVPSGLDHMSRELLQSIEGILRRHIGTAPEGGGALANDYYHGAPSAHMENSMVSQLTDFDHEYYQQAHAPLRSHTYSNSSGEELKLKPNQKMNVLVDTKQSQQMQHVPPVVQKNSTSPSANSIRKFSLGLGELFQQKPVVPVNRTQDPSPQHLRQNTNQQPIQQQQQLAYQPPQYHQNLQQPSQQHQSPQPPHQRGPPQSHTPGGGPLYTINDAHNEHSDKANTFPQATPTSFVSRNLDQDSAVEMSAPLQAVPSSSSMSIMSKTSKPQRVAASRQLRQEASNNPQNEAELKIAEAEYRHLMTELLERNDVKSAIKKDLKVWNSTFEKENGRPPGDADKAAVNDKFVAYKMVSSQVTDFKAQIKKAEDKIKRLKE